MFMWMAESIYSLHLNKYNKLFLKHLKPPVLFLNLIKKLDIPNDCLSFYVEYQLIRFNMTKILVFTNSQHKH